MKQFILRTHTIDSVPKSSDLTAQLSRKLIGQPGAILAIVPYVQMHQASLAPEGRPVGVFLLLGPTGTGKTRTVEALAEALHGNPKKVLKVDCGEYQMEHEVAKLIGAPPGYLGHRETQPLLNQQRLSAIASEDCDLSIVLFDEIEKAAPSMTRLLLGVLDKGSLRLGDNTTVNFEKTLIFMTSNLGSRAMQRHLRPDFGFETFAPRQTTQKCAAKLQSIGLTAVKRRFSPEFVNRVDAVVTYQPLDSGALSRILDQQIEDLQRHIDNRLGLRSFQIEVLDGPRRFLRKKGTSVEYGARELKRTLHRLLTQPLAALVSAGSIQPGGLVRVECNASREKLRFRSGDERIDGLSAA
jgi:ATP-dependent Clp protease ATP-binding subunit ClpA